MSNPYKTITHKGRILIYLRARQPNWISSAELEHQGVEWAAKPSTIGRRSRELQEEGRIEAKMLRGVVWYRLTQGEVYKPV